MSVEEEHIGAFYFQGDEEEGDVREEEPLILSWRGDAETTHSDWTIVIDTDGNEPSQTYHVHKAILAVGAHSCTYFSTLFATSVTVSERQDNTSRITLGKEQAEAFPIMLDFVYSPLDDLQGATTENAVALRSLARYFRCRLLLKYINIFIQQDLSPATAAIYLVKSSECNDEMLEQSTRNLILDNYGESSLLGILPVPLFCSIVSSPKLKECNHSDASLDIANYFQANPDALSAPLLNQLTHHLSGIHRDAAQTFIDLIEMLNPNQDKESWIALDSLCKKCGDTLAVHWKEMDIEKYVQDFHNPSIQGDYHGSGRLAISQLAAALDAAKMDCHEKEQQIKRQNAKIAALKNQIAVLKRRVRAERPPPARRAAALQQMEDSSDDIDDDTPLVMLVERRARQRARR